METKQEVYEVIKANPSLGLSGESRFRKRFPRHYEIVRSIDFPEDFLFSQKLYHYLNDLPYPVLGVCGKPVKFKNFSFGYFEYCKKRCECMKDVTNAKMRATNLERYGSSAPLGNGEVLEKSRETCRERYGTESYSKTQEFKERMVELNTERYGVEQYMSTGDFRAKAGKTMRERYRDDVPMRSDVIKGRQRATCEERYGVANPFQAEGVKEKIRESNKERYGVEYPAQNGEIRKKQRESYYKSTGYYYPAQNKEVQRRIREKSRETCLERYGTEYAMSVPEIHKKTEDTCMERYGVPYYVLSPEIKKGYSSDSSPNREFASLLDGLGIAYEREFVLGRRSYDFKVGDVLVEIDPTATHNTAWSPFGRGGGIDKRYHLSKTETGEGAGYRVVHIFGWEDARKVVSTFLAEKTVVYARCCEVRGVGADEAGAFLDSYHLQGSCRGMSRCYGLFLKDGTLAGVAAFGKPRYNKRYEYEFLRLCFLPTHTIVGGAGKLFSAFLKDVAPASVISYCDRSKFAGGVYSSIGFRHVKDSAPAVHWHNDKTGRHVTGNMLRRLGFDKIFGTDFGKGTSNDGLMLEHGFAPVYDCGQSVFAYEK